MKAYILDREDVRQAMQVIIEVTKQVKKGRNYLILLKAHDRKREISWGHLKEEALRRRRKPDVRSFLWH